MTRPRSSLARSTRTTAAMAAIALMTLAACGTDDPVAPRPAHVGSYRLLTIDGTPLPVVVTSADGARVRVTRGSVLLQTGTGSSGLYVRSRTTQPVDANGAAAGAEQVLECRGTYQVVESTVLISEPNFAPGCGGNRTSTLDGDRLLVADGSAALVYRR